MASGNRLETLISEEEEMNQVRLEFCNRCHSVLRSETFTVDSDRPIITYQQPIRCSVCKDNEYYEDPSNMQGLPNESNGILCRCQNPECGIEFYSRPSWYKKQQSIKNQELLRWMPVLIDPDKEKIDKLLNDQQEAITT
jgi:hypothetical protein